MTPQQRGRRSKIARLEANGARSSLAIRAPALERNASA
jgi:hypothetical protein